MRITPDGINELDHEELSEIEVELKKGNSLKDILTRDYPGAGISVVRGYDPFYDESPLEAGYTCVAYFTRNEAEKDIKERERHPNGTPGLTAQYHIIKQRIIHLTEGTEDRRGIALDKFDIKRIYETLEEKFKYPQK